LSGVYYVDKPENSGDLIFPGWLPHKVPRNDSDQRRVSISFNAA